MEKIFSTKILANIGEFLDYSDFNKFRKNKIKHFMYKLMEKYVFITENLKIRKIMKVCHYDIIDLYWKRLHMYLNKYFIKFSVERLENITKNLLENEETQLENQLEKTNLKNIKNIKICN